MDYKMIETHQGISILHIFSDLSKIKLVTSNKDTWKNLPIKKIKQHISR